MATFNTNIDLNTLVGADSRIYAPAARVSGNNFSGTGLENIIIQGTNTTLTANHINIACNIMTMSSDTQGFTQNGGTLSISNDGNDWFWQGGTLNLRGVYCYGTSTSANLRWGASFAVKQGSGLTGDIIDGVFIANNSRNFNLGCENLDDQINELRTIYLNGFVHQRIAGKTFVGVSFGGGSATQGGATFNYRTVPSITSAWSNFWNCDLAGWLNAQGNNATQNFNINSNNPNTNQHYFVINPINPPANMSVGYRISSGGFGRLRILTGWNPQFRDVISSETIDDILLDIDGITVFRKPDIIIPSSIPTEITTRYVPPVEVGSTGFMLQHGTTSVNAGTSAVSSSALPVSLTQQSIPCFSYTHICYNNFTVREIQTQQDATLGSGATFSETHVISLEEDSRAMGFSIDQARGFMGGTTQIQDLDELSSATKVFDYDNRRTTAIANSENGILDINSNIIFNNNSGFRLTGSTLEVGATAQDTPLIGTKFNTVKTNSDTSVNLSGKTLRFSTLGGRYTVAKIQSNGRAIDGGDGNLVIGSSSNSTMITFFRGESYILRNCDLTNCDLVASGSSGEVALTLEGTVVLPDPLPANFVIPLSGTITVSKGIATDPHYISVFTREENNGPNGGDLFTLVESTTDSTLSLNSSTHPSFTPGRVYYVFAGGQYFLSSTTTLTVGSNGLDAAIMLMQDNNVNRNTVNDLASIQIEVDTQSNDLAVANKFSQRGNPIFINFSGVSATPLSVGDSSRLICSLRNTEPYARASLQSFVDSQPDPITAFTSTATRINRDYVTLGSFEQNASGTLVQQNIEGVFFVGATNSDDSRLIGNVIAVLVEFTENTPPSVLNALLQNLLNEISELDLGGGGGGTTLTVENISNRIERENGPLDNILSRTPINQPNIDTDGNVFLAPTSRIELGDEISGRLQTERIIPVSGTQNDFSDWVENSDIAERLIINGKLHLRRTDGINDFESDFIILRKNENGIFGGNDTDEYHIALRNNGNIAVTIAIIVRFSPSDNSPNIDLPRQSVSLPPNSDISRLRYKFHDVSHETPYREVQLIVRGVPLYSTANPNEIVLESEGTFRIENREQDLEDSVQYIRERTPDSKPTVNSSGEIRINGGQELNIKT